MELETLNKLYLELSQIATATTNREMELHERLRVSNQLLRSAHEIAVRKGEKTNWDTFLKQLKTELYFQHNIIYPKIT